MTLDEITFTIGDPSGRVSLKALTAALENALDMIRIVEARIISSGVEVNWEVVRVKMRSPLTMSFSPRVTAKPMAPRLTTRKGQSIGKQIVKACINGIEQIERNPIMPEHFDDEALAAARQLVKSVGSGVLKVSGGKHEVKLTAQAISNIDEIATRARLYTDVGTIEGRLEEISVHGTPQAMPQIRIWDSVPVPGHSVKCAITEDRLPVVKELLGLRVAVTGPIHYRNHKPMLIDVQQIQRLRMQDELPQIETMEPIDITGDLSPEEYVRRMRDAE
jgi:hypothetical protein